MNLQEKIATLPNRPGIYRFLDGQGSIIYIGKARKLRNRVRSYFNDTKSKSGKTRVMVRNIEDLEYMEVESEQDALLLENNQIKEYKPKYNILLKDDKTFPWLCIKNEPFPRVFSTRKKSDDGSEYYGPYASVKLMKTLLSLAASLYPLRTCNYQLSQENIQAGKFKVCLEYHIGNCKGPCEGKQTREEYDDGIDTIRNIIKGRTRQVVDRLEAQMSTASEGLDFERAQRLKEQLELVLKYQSSSAVVSNSVHDAEVYHYREEKQKVFIGFLKVVDGAVVQGHTTELTGGTDESREERLGLAIQSIRSESQTDAQELIVPFMPEGLHEDGLTITIPKRGEKRQLLELCERNVKYYLLEKRKQERIVDPDAHFQRILDQTQEDLRMKESPRHIECFDNSNLQGNQPVAACVVFKDGRPSKKDYRHFNIKTVEGPDDFASMREVVHRRYKRLLEESEPLPQLIVIDGGKGQLSAAVESLEILGLRGQITVIGIAKRLEEIYFPGDSVPLHIDKRSESLKLIQQLRNEAHRFGITHHRNRRSKAAIKSTLTEIEGIGETTAQKLLKHFGSVKNVKEANEEQLAKLIGKAKSRTIFSYFHPD